MDVTEQGGKVCHIVNRLRFESIFEQVPVATVLAVIIEHIATGNALDSLTHGLSALTYQQMQMVRHQTIGIISTFAPAWCPFVVVTKTHSVECRDELEIVLFIIKYLLVVDTTYHHMVNPRSRLLS